MRCYGVWLVYELPVRGDGRWHSVNGLAWWTLSRECAEVTAKIIRDRDTFLAEVFVKEFDVPVEV